MTIRPAAIVIFFAICWLSSFVYAQECVLVAQGASGQIGIPAKTLGLVQRAYARLDRVRPLQARLYVCDDDTVNAFSRSDGNGHGLIAVHRGLLALTGDDEGEIAVTIAHEMGHLIHNHFVLDPVVSTQLANQYAIDRWRFGQPMANLLAHLDRAAIGRNQEREADDEALILIKQAGYALSAARRLFDQFQSVFGSNEHGYFDDHPGAGERFRYATRVEANDTYRASANAAFAAKDWVLLQTIVEEWSRLMPDSGSAAYFRAVLSEVHRAGPARIAFHLEDSVNAFQSESVDVIDISARLQRTYSESTDATISLCISLYREGQAVHAIECAQRLSREDIQRFKSAVGIDTVIVPSHLPWVTRTTLSSKRDGSGDADFTNCTSITTTDRSYRKVEPWRAARFREAYNRHAAPMICDESLCDCRPFHP